MRVALKRKVGIGLAGQDEVRERPLQIVDRFCLLFGSVSLVGFPLGPVPFFALLKDYPHRTIKCISPDRSVPVRMPFPDSKG